MLGFEECLHVTTQAHLFGDVVEVRLDVEPSEEDYHGTVAEQRARPFNHRSIERLPTRSN